MKLWSLIPLSFSLLVLTIVGCAPEPDREPAPAKNPTAYQASADQLAQKVSLSNGRYGLRLSKDTSAKEWVELYESTPGEVKKLDSSPYQFKITIDGHDVREWLDGAEFRSSLPDSENRMVATATSLAPHYFQKKYGVYVDFFVDNASPRLRIEINRPGETNPKVEITPPTTSEVALPDGSHLTFGNKQFPSGDKVTSWRVEVELTPKPVVKGSLNFTPAQIIGPDEDRNALNGLQYRFFLANFSNAEDPHSLGPFGASSPRYDGHVFWDADSWWFPALCLSDPKAAANISNFRLKGLAAAKAAAQAAFHAGGDLGAKYPWESGPQGEELAPTDARNQEHISADVALMLAQASALGITPEDKAEQALQEIATYYDRRSTKTADGYTVKNVVSPSEWHACDDDLYTNAMMGRVFELAGKPQKVVLPRDNTTFITFKGDKLGSYQQAAALLALFPAQNPEVEKDATKMLDRFADKTDPAGPAMSHSINALLYARDNQPDKAYAEWQKSWKLYTDDPYTTFREKPKYGDSYFYTGAAGCLNAVYYGFMGLRLDPYEPKGKPWKTPLKNGWWLSADPHLPKAWTALEIDLNILGKPIRLHADHQGINTNPATPR